MDLAHYRNPANVGQALINGIRLANRYRHEARAGVNAVRNMARYARRTARAVGQRWRVKRTKPAAKRAITAPPNNSNITSTKYAQPKQTYRKRFSGRRRFNFQARFRQAMFKELAAQDLVVTGTDGITQAAGNNRIVMSIALNHGDDIQQALSRAVGTSDSFSQKVYVTKSRMDVQFYGNQNQLQYVDVYTVVARRDQTYSETNGIDQAFNFTELQFLTGTELPQSAYAGLTPFQSHHFCENWIIKKCQKVYLEGNNGFSITVQGRRGRIDSSDWDSQYLTLGGQEGSDTQTSYRLFAKRGWTVGLLVIAQGHPQSGNVNASMNAARLDWQYTKSWTVKVLEGNKRTLFFDNKNISLPTPGYVVDQEGNTIAY